LHGVWCQGLVWEGSENPEREGKVFLVL